LQIVITCLMHGLAVATRTGHVSYRNCQDGFWPVFAVRTLLPCS
jgi:hypothetical protein